MTAAAGGPVWKAFISVALATWLLAALLTMNPVLVVVWVMLVAAIAVGQDGSIARRLWEGNF